MKGTLRPSVKICCITSIREAQMAIDYGASALGLVGNMPSGPGIIDDKLIKSIASVIPSGIESFLLTSEINALDIIAHHHKANTNTIQIVDKLNEGHYNDIRMVLPSVNLVQVIHVVDQNSIDEAIIASKYVDAILLDSGNPNLSTKVLGGTGNIHDWEISKQIREAIPIPMYLAGGLNSTNISEAIRYVQPFGIDLCSGVRTNGKLDKLKLSRFFEVVNSVN